MRYRNGRKPARLDVLAHGNFREGKGQTVEALRMYFVAIGGLAGQQNDLICVEKPVLTAR